MKNERGITLIILVTTIILLLIITSITVTYTIKGDIIGSAKRAKFVADVAQIQETIELIKAKPKYLKSGIDKETLIEELEEEKASSKIWKKYSDILVIWDDCELYYNVNNVTEEQKQWLESVGVVSEYSSFKKFVMAQSQGKDFTQAGVLSGFINTIKQEYENVVCLADVYGITRGVSNPTKTKEFLDVETMSYVIDNNVSYDTMSLILENDGEIIELNSSTCKVKNYEPEKYRKIATIKEANEEFVIKTETTSDEKKLNGTIVSYFGNSSNPVIPMYILGDGKIIKINKIGEKAFIRTENPEEVLAYEVLSEIFEDDDGNIDESLSANTKNSMIISFCELAGIDYTVKDDGMAYVLKFDTITSSTSEIYLEDEMTGKTKDEYLKIGRYYIEKDANVGKKNYRNNITSIEIPITIEEIGARAFEGQPIEKLEIIDSERSSNNLTIGRNAFRFCTELKSINIEIGIDEDDAFEYNDSLEEIIVDSAIFNSCFKNSTKIKKIIATIDYISFYQSCFGNTPDFELLEAASALSFGTNVQFGENCGLKKVKASTITGTTTKPYAVFTNCLNLEEITIERDTYAQSSTKWGAPDTTVLTITGSN